MKRSVLAIAAGLIFAVGMTGCGGSEPDIPEGYSEEDIRSADDAPVSLPGRDIEGPEKSSGGGAGG